jgi:hypothetical protein
LKLITSSRARCSDRRRLINIDAAQLLIPSFS